MSADLRHVLVSVGEVELQKYIGGSTVELLAKIDEKSINISNLVDLIINRFGNEIFYEKSLVKLILPSLNKSQANELLELIKGSSSNGDPWYQLSEVNFKNPRHLQLLYSFFSISPPELDEGEALEIQRAACQNNKSMFLPPGIVKRPTIIKETNAQSIILKWMKQFANPNGTIAYIQELKAKLSYNVSHSIIEQALCDFAPLLGAQGSRPEKEFDDGPDDLWLWDDISLVIEVKNENKNSLHKKDAGQLLVSLEWFKRTFSGRNDPLPITVAKVSVSDNKAHYPPETRVITPKKMAKLLNKIEKFYRMLVDQPLLGSNARSLAQLQQRFSLLPEQFVGNYTEKIT